MYVVDNIRGDVNGALEAEGGICAVDIVVNSLRESDDVHSGIHQELCALLRPVAAHDDQAVEVEAVIGVEHGGDKAVAVLVNDVFSGDIALAGGAEYRAALGKDAGEVIRLHEFVIPLYKAAIAVVHTVYLKVFDMLK